MEITSQDKVINPACGTGAGVVLLGPAISCDGFYFGHSVRVQTHVHADHFLLQRR